MAAPHTEYSIQTGNPPDFDGHLRLEIDQLSQDKGAFTSRVRVQGWMVNDNDRAVDHPGGGNIERHISGEDSYYPGDFDFNIQGHHEWCFISHTFTVAHDISGRKTVTFTVHYGQTDTPTFGGDKSVTDSLMLNMLSNNGAWIRRGGKWYHAEAYVRHQGHWKLATAYVRSGGSWKRAQ